MNTESFLTLSIGYDKAKVLRALLHYNTNMQLIDEWQIQYDLRTELIHFCLDSINMNMDEAIKMVTLLNPDAFK